MKKIKVLFAIICLTLMATMTPLVSHAADVDIKVAPNVINFDSPCPCVTVHADIAFTSVDTGTVVLSLHNSLDLIYSYDCFADDRGLLVAKFHMTEVEEGLPDEAGSYIFALSGLTLEKDSFYGEQIVKVFSISMDEKPGKQGKDVVDP